MSGADIPEDYNIQEAWDKACRAFARMTQADLTASPKLSVDEVLEDIRRKQDDDEEKHKKYRAAKDVISKTGNFIMVLGGIAAQGASMVFAPSSLCFNAISYLIETGAKYKRIFSSLAELFQRISDVLERCKIYMRLPAEAVDALLRKIINEELVCFVEICALSIKVMRGNKMLIALKVFAFDSDEGVSAQLERLASLVERESQMRATLGFESQKISERIIVEARDGTRRVSASVDELLTFEKKKDADSMAMRLLSSIDNNLDMPSETFKDTQAIFKRYLSEQVSGSGRWLQSDPLYASWVDSPRSRCSILGLSGAQGVGKSVLFATVVKHLQEISNQDGEDKTRTSVAYYIFDKDKNDPSLLKALQVLAWQIAKADMMYRKDLSSAQTASVNQVGSIWDILFGRSSKRDSTFYLLIDGVEQMDKQHLKEFLHVLDEWQSRPPGWSKFTLRILLSGRTEVMGRVKDQLGDGISIIDVTLKNHDDILKFINNEMDKMDILSGSTDQVKSLRDEILDGLANRTNGDFVSIRLLLDEISTKQRPSEIRDIISRSGEDKSDTIVRTIAALNETLSNEDISDLNELLTWVLFAWRPLSVEELEAVLFLKSGEPSLRPLAEKIRGQYSSLFRIAAANVHLASESIADFLRQSLTPSDLEEAPRNTTEVSESEVRIIRRFLESVCDPALYAKFQFDEFFLHKLKGKTTILVAVDAEMAHLKLARACLDVLCSSDSSSPHLNDLDYYAVHHFAQHLALTDPALTLPRHKIALGPQLVKVFTDEKVIERWWDCNSHDLRMHWIYRDDYAEVLMKWLQDSAVTKDVPQKDREWVRSLSDKSQLDTDLLEHVARVLARQWLHSDTWDILRPFMALHGYITKIKNRKSPSIARAIRDPSSDTIPAADVLDAAEWAQAQLDLGKLGYEESRNVARTLREYEKYEEAIQQFKHTSMLAEENWLSQHGLAVCYASQGDLDVAIDILEATINKIKEGEYGESKEADESLPDMYNDLATWHRSNGRDEVALAIYQKQLDVDRFDYDTASNLIILLHEQARHTDLVELLQSLKNATDPDSALDLRTKTVQKHSLNELFNEALFALAQRDAGFGLVLESYENALAAARAQLLEARKAGNLREERFAQGEQITIMRLIATLYQRASHGSPTREKCAIDYWLRIMEMDGTHDWWLAARQARVRSQFAVFCFEKAMALQSSDLAAEYIQHLEDIISFKKPDDALLLFWSHPSCLLARYHRLQGNHDKAKSILRFYIKLNLDLLSDDDPLNDSEAYHDLAVLFMFAGDDIDALAAWSLITPTNVPEAGNGGLGNTEKNNHKLVGPMLAYCDGECGTRWTFADDFYVCKACFDVRFDEICLHNLRAGTLKRKVCNPEHDMMHVPGYDPSERNRIGKGNVKVGEDIVPVEEWLRRIRRDWGLDAA
ncbi:hypothetical protein BJX62DRAFT_252146 [Aspergillus germanicus]